MPYPISAGALEACGRIFQVSRLLSGRVFYAASTTVHPRGFADARWMKWRNNAARSGTVAAQVSATGYFTALANYLHRVTSGQRRFDLVRWYAAGKHP